MVVSLQMLNTNTGHSHVEVREKLEEGTLKDIDFCCMPCPTATDTMASKASFLQKRGGRRPRPSKSLSSSTLQGRSGLASRSQRRCIRKSAGKQLSSTSDFRPFPATFIELSCISKPGACRTRFSFSMQSKPEKRFAGSFGSLVTWREP